MITAAQVWYLANVYPERLTAEEASEYFEKEVKENGLDRSYWEAVAIITNELVVK